MMMEAHVLGPILTLAFGLVLRARVRFENRVLRPLRRGLPGVSLDAGGHDERG